MDTCQGDACYPALENHNTAEDALFEVTHRFEGYYYSADWGDDCPSYEPNENDLFWQWCLGLGGPSVSGASPITSTLTPQVQTNPIILKASLEGKGESLQTLPNNDNYGVIIIDGIVTDQEGKGVGGADVEVVSGANSASIMTNADGSYSIAVSVPGGLGNGLYQGVNFTLQLGDLSIHEIVLLQAIEGGPIRSSGHADAHLVF